MKPESDWNVVLFVTGLVLALAAFVLLGGWRLLGGL